MKKISYTITLIATFIFTFLQTPLVAAISPERGIHAGVEAAYGDGQPTDLLGDAGVITSVTNLLLFIVGALAVVMVIWGGLRYVVSGGSSSAVTAAKNTIMYAIIGLIVAFLAFAAVNFVLSAVTPGGGAGFTDV